MAMVGLARRSRRQVRSELMIEPLKRQAAWLLMAMSGLSLAVAWVFASPVGASPDEGAHVLYSWGTVTGQTIGDDERLVTIRGGRNATIVRVPQTLLQAPAASCYAFKPEKPVTSCLAIPADNQQVVTRSSYMSRYPPLFYAVEGSVLKAAIALDLSGVGVLYSARLASAVLSLLTFGFGVSLLARRFPAPVVLLAALLGFTATTWFLASSVNPNGLEVAAAFLLAAGVLSLRVDHTLATRSIAAIVAVPLGTLLLAWTRPLSWIWASLILTVLLVPTSPRNGESWTQRLPVRRLGAVAFSGTVLVLASAMAWFVYALQIRAAEITALESPAAWAELNPVGRIVLLLLHSGRILTDQIGTFGWMDTPLPTVAIFLWVSVSGVASVIWVVGRNRLMPHWAVGAILGLGYLVALLDEYKEAWGWQGRYLLTVTAAVWVLAVPGLSQGLERLAGLRQVVPWMLGVLMSVNALSLVWFLFRNVYGVTVWPRRLPPVPLPSSPPSWAPVIGQGFVLALMAVAFACGCLAVWMLQHLPEGEEAGTAPLPHDRDADHAGAGVAT